MTAAIEKCIVNAYLHNSKLDAEVLKIEGMSSPKVRHLLNNLCNESVGYLEVGCWKGSTLISAAYKNDALIWAYDDFSEFNDGTIENSLSDNINRFLTHGENLTFRNIPLQKINRYDAKPFNIDCLFIDCKHDHQTQYEAIEHLTPFCLNEFVLVVDDWNHEPVRTGTMEGLKEFNLTVKENYWLPAIYNGDLTGWWNGLFVARIVK